MIRVEQVHGDPAVGAFDEIAPRADLDRAAFGRERGQRFHHVAIAKDCALES
jgi:hypothetical protein